MKKIDWKMLIFTGIICLLPILLGVVLYDKLPSRVAIHFNFYGEADGWLAKPWFVFGTPVLMLALQAFSCIVTDLTDKRREANRKATRVFKWMIPTLCCALYVVTVCIALGYDVDVRRVVMLILGLVFIVAGNYAPKTRNMNYPTRKKQSEQVQRKIARYMGYSMILGGFACLLSIAFSPIVSIIVIVLLLAVLCVMPFCVRK